MHQLAFIYLTLEVEGKAVATRIPADVFSPGEFIKDELIKREWSQCDLAELLGHPVQAVNEIVAGKKAITPEVARGLGDAIGTGRKFGLNWKLSSVRDLVT